MFSCAVFFFLTQVALRDDAKTRLLFQLYLLRVLIHCTCLARLSRWHCPNHGCCQSQTRPTSPEWLLRVCIPILTGGSGCCNVCTSIDSSSFPGSRQFCLCLCGHCASRWNSKYARCHLHTSCHHFCSLAKNCAARYRPREHTRKKKQKRAHSCVAQKLSAKQRQDNDQARR